MNLLKSQLYCIIAIENNTEKIIGIYKTKKEAEKDKPENTKYTFYRVKTI